jgi:hypothetical protein
MRLLILCLLIVGLAFVAQNIRPQCSMANMLGVEWVECVIESMRALKRSSPVPAPSRPLPETRVP